MSPYELPETWQWVKLGEITEIVGGGTPSRENPNYFGGNIPWATPTDITALDQLWIYATKESITQEGLRSSSAKLLPVGTVLMTSRATIGFTALAGQEMATNQGFASFICDESVLFNEYLAYYLSYIREWLIQIAGGTTFKEVSKSVLASIEIPLPTLPEQRHIAEILHQADNLRRFRERTLRLLARLIPSVFSEMFGDPLQNTKDWEQRKLHRLGEIVTGNTPPRRDPKNYGDFIEWIKSDNLGDPLGRVMRSEESLSEKGAKTGRIVPAGSTLITCIAGSPNSIGKAGLTDRTVAFNQQINAVVPFDDVNPVFLYGMIAVAKPAIQALSSGGMKGIVNKSRLSGLELIYPPKSLQDRFELEVNHMSRVGSSVRSSETAIGQLRESILASAFTGGLTETWREIRLQQLHDAAMQRDTALGLRDEEPTHGDYKRGHVTQAEREEIEQRISDSLRPVLSQMALYNPFGDTLRAIEAGQARWAEQLAQIMQPISIQLPTIEIAPLLSDAVSNAMLGFQSRLAVLNQENWNAMASLTSQYALIADATRSIRETFASSLQPITLQLTTVIENLARSIDEWPPSDHLRFDVIVHLNRRQKLIHFTCERQEQPFTADTIRAESNFSMELVRRDLSLLASLGLISAVSIPAESSEGPTYVNAYRLIPDVDQILLTDLSVFQSLGRE